MIARAFNLTGPAWRGAALTRGDALVIIAALLAGTWAGFMLAATLVMAAVRAVAQDFKRRAVEAADGGQEA